jgi:hypothetical protein
MKKVFFASFIALVVFACNKKEPEAAMNAVESAVKMIVPHECAKEIITEKPVKVGETGLVLPIGTKLCFSSDNLEIRVELPVGHNFWSNKALPIYATYTCNCSASGSACQVFYAEGLGFGCLQSSCSGSCTGKFTYKGYTVEKVISTKSEFFELPEVQAEIKKITPTGAWSKHEVFGVSFFLVSNEEKFMAAATCDCDGTQACKLKKVKIPFIATIYFCEGPCNGCELTV